LAPSRLAGEHPSKPKEKKTLKAVDPGKKEKLQDVYRTKIGGGLKKKGSRGVRTGGDLGVVTGGGGTGNSYYADDKKQARKRSRTSVWSEVLPENMTRLRENYGIPGILKERTCRGDVGAGQKNGRNLRENDREYQCWEYGSATLGRNLSTLSVGTVRSQ